MHNVSSIWACFSTEMDWPCKFMTDQLLEMLVFSSAAYSLAELIIQAVQIASVCVCVCESVCQLTRVL